MPLRNYAASAACNAAAAIGLAGAGWLFIAWQRASRLREQLNDLVAIVLGDREDDIEQLYKLHHERQEEWNAALKAIQTDIDRIPDRLVRLNAATQCRLAAVFDGLDERLGKDLAKILSGESIGDPVIARAVEKLKRLRASINIWSFLEVPRRRR